MNETSKGLVRRLHDVRFVTRYFVGEGINVGAGFDHLSFYGSLFPLMSGVKEWDVEDGDGMLLESVGDETYDFLHSSHCLEHLQDPMLALSNWIRVVKPGGHIIFTVPDEDLFEQGVWPSLPSGSDHLTSWTIAKTESWAPNSCSLLALLPHFAHCVTILKIELIDRMYLYDKEPIDWTLLPAGHECAIEVILRKKTPEEFMWKGMLSEAKVVAAEEVKHNRENPPQLSPEAQEEIEKLRKEQDKALKQINKKKRKPRTKKKEWVEPENQSTSEIIKAPENNGSLTA